MLAQCLFCPPPLGHLPFELLRPFLDPFLQFVFGLLQNARVDEPFITNLLPQLPGGDSELYSHPSLDEFKHEFDALVSPAIKKLVREQNIELIRYQDL